MQALRHSHQGVALREVREDAFDNEQGLFARTEAARDETVSMGLLVRSRASPRRRLGGRPERADAHAKHAARRRLQNDDLRRVRVDEALALRRNTA